VVKKDGQRLWAIASVDVLSRLRGTHAARHRAGRDRGAAVERARQDRVRLRRGRERMRGGEAGPGDGGQVDGWRGGPRQTVQLRMRAPEAADLAE